MSMRHNVPRDATKGRKVLQRRLPRSVAQTDEGVEPWNERAPESLLQPRVAPLVRPQVVNRPDHPGTPPASPVQKRDQEVRFQQRAQEIPAVEWRLRPVEMAHIETLSKESGMRVLANLYTRFLDPGIQ